MKLLAYTIGGQKIGVDIKSWNNATLSGNTAFQAIADNGTIPSGYTNISSFDNWANLGAGASLTPDQIKVEMLKLIPNIPTAGQYLTLESYATAGLNSISKIGTNTIFGAAITGSTVLTGTTTTSGVAVTTFNTYTGTTAPAQFASKTALNTYTGTTAPATFVCKTNFNTYTGATHTCMDRHAYLSGATFTGTLCSACYFLGTDLSLLPIGNNQSAISSWWGLQLRGYYQGDMCTTPVAVGNRDSYSVVIKTDCMPTVSTLSVVAAASQTAAVKLQTWQTSALVTVASVDCTGSAVFNGGLIVTGATNAITLGGSGTQTICIGANTGTKTICIGNNDTPANIIDIGGSLSTVCLGSLTTIIGIAGTSNCNGIRHGASRVIVHNKPNTPTTGLNANCSLSVSYIFETGIIGYSVATSVKCLTIPTACGASGLVQALPCAQVGDIFTFVVYNTTATGLCICGSTNTTIATTNCVLSTNSPRTINLRVTSISANAETITVY